MSDIKSVMESDAGSVVEPKTSTIEYDHRSWITIRLQVLALAKQTVWVDSATAEISVEYLVRSEHSRAIGITRQAQDKTNTRTSYILKVRRFHDTQVDNDVATLLFVQRYSEIPAPRVITFDNSATNQLNSPYMIQTRLENAGLYFCMPRLSQEQRCQLARELGSVFRQMLSIRSNKAGRLVLPSDNKTLDAPLHVAPWIQADIPISTAYDDSAPSETVYDLLINTLRTRKAEELKLRPNSTSRHDLITRFMSMAAQLEEAGWLSNCPYSLAHLDITPHNIMIRRPFNNSERPIISGILGWDSAVFSPMFMSCTPPIWLWDWERDDSDDEIEVADYLPPTKDGQTLKDIFEEAAGPEFKRFAYQNAYRLARQLVQFTINGLRSNEDIKVANTMLEEWQGILLSNKISCFSIK
ncbi:hypothetical protein F5Y12DRAFT_764825 [Xylaria sp. FL1777]|nr:hypothetical protein F5Y12DRAFT_764825 [Xylaria sp. FL1777]